MAPNACGIRMGGYLTSSASSMCVQIRENCGLRFHEGIEYTIISPNMDRMRIFRLNKILSVLSEISHFLNELTQTHRLKSDFIISANYRLLDIAKNYNTECETIALGDSKNNLRTLSVALSYIRTINSK